MCSIDIMDVIAEINPESLTLQDEEFDDCVIGICERYNYKPVVAYDKKMVIDKLVDTGLKRDLAEEFFQTHMIDEDRGEHSPVFITRLDAT